MPHCLAGFVLLAAATAAGQSPRVAMPGWLAPFPDAKVEGPVVHANRVEASYVSAAATGEIVSHYRELFAAQGIPFVLNPDGLGVTIRGRKECSLLIAIRESKGQTLTRITCTALPSQDRDTDKPAPQVEAKAPAPSPRWSRDPAKNMDPRTRQAIEESEARHRKRVQDMSVYDQPVYPKRKKRGSDAAGAAKQ